MTARRAAGEAVLGHCSSPRRLVTDKNQSSRLACTRRRPWTAIPASTRRRVISSACSRGGPGASVTVSPSSVRAMRDAIALWPRARAAAGGSEHCTSTDIARPSDQLVDGSLADDLATIDDGHLVARAFHLIEEVGGQHDRPSLVDQAADHLAHLVDARRVQAVHWLVEDEQFRVAQQAAGHAEALAHAHGVIGDLVVGPLGQPRALQYRVDPLVGVSSSGHGERLQVLPSGEVAMEPGLVDDRTHSGQSALTLGRDGEAEQRHRAAVGFGEAKQDPDQRGLACPIRPQVAEGRAPRDEQVHVVDGSPGAEALGEPGHLDGPVASLVRTGLTGARPAGRRHGRKSWSCVHNP